MTKEITSKLDEIIELDVNAYIDTYVKRYSSGMYMYVWLCSSGPRNQNLIIDEVLAVGDARKKPLARCRIFHKRR
jgi:ABC-type polysaccharide/polyol phosphate transport system ATPase subunit